MGTTFTFIRVLFFALGILIATSFATSDAMGGITPINLALGAVWGVVIGGVLIAAEQLLKRTNIQNFNAIALGLFFGYLFGLAAATVFSGIFHLAGVSVEYNWLVQSSIYLLAVYFGVFLTANANQQFHISVPFVKFQPRAEKKKDVLLDSSILLDARIIDLATSGLLDNHFLVPRFMVKELYEMAEGPNESVKGKARRCLDVIKKLEVMPDLNLRYTETDFPEIKEQTSKLIKLARMLDANILTADMSRVEQSSVEGVKIINIHSLSNSIKPLTHAGEYLNIKVQRYGKEPRQGVGYLEDGTMVVINGGAEYIGETIKAQVLSVKHTTSGRMIFCNATEETLLSDQEVEQSLDKLQGSQKSYFSL